jgi:toxin ParE1/3/4
MRVKFTDQAETNLEEIGDFIALENPERAASFVEDLRQHALNIGDFPEAYPIVSRHRAKAVRRCVHGDYLIFYRISGNQIDVLHIFHGARNVNPDRF